MLGDGSQMIGKIKTFDLNKAPFRLLQKNDGVLFLRLFCPLVFLRENWDLWICCFVDGDHQLRER